MTSSASASPVDPPVPYADRERCQDDLRAAIVDSAPAVRRFLFGMCGNWAEAEDLAQEALLAAWAKRDRFDGRSQPKTWIYAIARNLWLDRLRRKRVRPKEHPMIDDLPEPATEESPVAAASRKELAAAFRVALDALPPEQREVLALRESPGMTVSQIADLLGVPVSTVKSRTRYALSKLTWELRAFDKELES